MLDSVKPATGRGSIEANGAVAPKQALVVEKPDLLIDAQSGHGLVVPEGFSITEADYVRMGPDLVLVAPDGTTLLIRGYFTIEDAPDLVGADGALIPGDLALKLAGPLAPGELAQAGAKTAQQAIGRADTLSGNVTVIHADGTKGVLHKGDSIFQGDILQTDKGASIGMLFMDGTTMALGGNGRLVLDEMVYDAATHTGKSAFSLVQGSFSFVSGQIAKSAPDAATIRTPVATIGIRGTLGSGGYVPGSGLTVALLPEGSGNGEVVGELVLYNQGGTQTINNPNTGTQIQTQFSAPPPPILLNVGQITANFGQVLQNLASIQGTQSATSVVQIIIQQAETQNVKPGDLSGQGGKLPPNVIIAIQPVVNDPKQEALNKAAQEVIDKLLKSDASIEKALEVGIKEIIKAEEKLSKGGKLEEILKELKDSKIEPTLEHKVVQSETPVTMPPITVAPTAAPTVEATVAPTVEATVAPTVEATVAPTSPPETPAPSIAPTSAPVSGKAVDGYVRDAVVFEDLDGDGALDGGEANDVTDANGNYTLTGAQGTGDIVVLAGGTDISTGLTITTVMRAPPGSANVTPLTTLVANMMDMPANAGLSAAQVAANMATALGLSGSADILATDPTTNDTLLKKAAAVQSMVVMLSSTLTGAGAPSGEAMTKVFAQMADAMQNGNFSLTDPAKIGAMLTAAANALPVPVTPNPDAAALIASANQTIANATSASDIVNAAKSAQGTMGDVLGTGSVAGTYVLDGNVNNITISTAVPTIRLIGAAQGDSVDDNNGNVGDILKLDNHANTISIYDVSTIDLHANSAGLTQDLTLSNVASINGTAGGDVLLVNGTASIFGGGGDDTLTIQSLAPSTLSFQTQAGPPTTGTNPLSLLLRDFNGDGNLDVVTANATGTVSVLLGNGSGGFGAKTDYAAGADVHAVTVADLNGDGKQDLIATVMASNVIKVWLGNGDGTFAAGNTIAMGNQPFGVATGDLNGDGKLDVVTADYGSTDISIRTGVGNGTFNALTTLSSSNNGAPHAVALADFNGDGKLDVAVSKYNNVVDVRLGNGDATFGSSVSYSTAGNANAMAVGDLNDDGKVDIVTSDNYGNSVSVLMGNGNGTFQAYASFSTSADGQVTSVALYDMNGDGNLDIVTASAGGNYASVLLGNGDGTFRAHSDFAAGTNAYGVAAGDLNNDNRPDLVTVNNTDSTISVILNNSQQSSFFGGDDNDTLIYEASANITVSLLDGTISDGSNSATMSGIENVTTGSGNDVLTGNDSDNVLQGGAGDDTFFGGLGNDTFDGGANTDTLSYILYGAGLSIDLAAGEADDGTGADLISNIENVIGTNHGDTIIGSSGANSLNGGLGGDTLSGGAGDDILTGGGGLDQFHFTAATDSGTKIITDFALGETIHFEDFDIATIAEGNAANVPANGVNVHYNLADNATTLYFNSQADLGTADYTITLQGVHLTPNDLTTLNGDLVYDRAPEVTAELPDMAALTFDGWDDKITLGDAKMFSGANDFTIAMWIKPTGDGGTLYRQDAHSGEFGIKTTLNANGSVYLGLDVQTTGGWQDLTTAAGTVAMDTWSHLALVKSGSSFSLFVNGEAVAGSTITLDVDHQNAATSTDYAYFGFEPWDYSYGSGTGVPYDGQLGNLIVYSTALDQSGVEWLMTNTPSSGDTALEELYTFTDTIDGITYADGSGNDRDLTLSGSDAPVITMTGQITATDATPGDTLTYEVLTDVQHGTLAIDNGSGAYTYTPSYPWSADSFEVKVTDSYGVYRTISVAIPGLGSVVGDDITGTSGNDLVNGGTGDDNITGLGGDDTLSGGGGGDWIEGGEGNDTYVLNALAGHGHTLYINDAGGDADILKFDLESTSSVERAITHIGREGNSLVFNLSQDYTGGSYEAGQVKILNQFAGNGREVEYITDSSGESIYLATETTVGLDGLVSLVGSGGQDMLVGNISPQGVLSEDVLFGGEGEDMFFAVSGQTLKGGDGNDTAAFWNFGYGITATLDSSGNADIVWQAGMDCGTFYLQSIENLEGSFYGDNVLTGNASNNRFSGHGFSNTIDGGDGTDTISYSNHYVMDNTTGIVVDLGVTDGNGYSSLTHNGIFTDKLKNIENIDGSDYNDTITGDDVLTGNGNRISGGKGNDILSGGDGNNDTVEYYDDISGVTVVLGASHDGIFGCFDGSVATDGWGGVDTVTGFEAVAGSDFDDFLMGNDDVATRFMPGQGDDRVIGRFSSGDKVEYYDSTDSSKDNYGLGGITVYLNSSGYASENAAGTDTLIADPWGGQDRLYGIDDITGSSYDDYLDGATRDASGNNQMEGRGGNDVLIGTGGKDSASYYSAEEGVVVNFSGDGYADWLADGEVSDGLSGIDTLTGIADIRGSSYADIFLKGSAAATFYGNDGDDEFDILDSSWLSNANFYGGDNTSTGDTLVLDDGTGPVVVDFTALTGTINGIEYVDLHKNVGYTLTLDADMLTNNDYTGDGVVDRMIQVSSSIGISAAHGVTIDASTFANTDSLVVYATNFAGDDSFIGGAGNDSFLCASYSAGAGFDSIDAGGGTDSLSFASLSNGVSVNLASGFAYEYASGFNTRAHFTGIEMVTGGTGGDTLIGTTGVDWLYGGNGGDTLNSGDGADYLYGGAGDDIIFSGKGADAINGGDGTDTVDYSASDTVTVSGWTVSGAIWLGQVTRVDGADTSISAINYVEKVKGSATGLNTVTFATSTSGVTIDMAAGTVTNATSSATLLNSFTVAIGSDYADTLIGSSAADTLEGNAGDDKLTGGSGADVFSFHTVQDTGTKTITDFSVGDKIDFSNYNDLNSANFRDVGTAGGDVLANGVDVYYAGGNTTLFINTTASDAAADYSIILEGVELSAVKLGLSGNDLVYLPNQAPTFVAGAEALTDTGDQGYIGPRAQQTAVRELIFKGINDFAYEDADGEVMGVAVVGTTATTGSQLGTWQYTLLEYPSSDSDWVDFPANVNASNALLLPLAGNVRFVPAAYTNNTEAVTLSIRVWDDSNASLSAGGTADLTQLGTGGTSPFSSDTMTYTVSMEAVSEYFPSGGGTSELTLDSGSWIISPELVALDYIPSTLPGSLPMTIGHDQIVTVSSGSTIALGHNFHLIDATGGLNGTQLTINGGSLTFATGSATYDVMNGGSLIDDGTTLTLTGGGTLATPDYRGTLNVEGLAKIYSGTLAGEGTLNVAEGGQLDFLGGSVDGRMDISAENGATINLYATGTDSAGTVLTLGYGSPAARLTLEASSILNFVGGGGYGATIAGTYNNFIDGSAGESDINVSGGGVFTFDGVTLGRYSEVVTSMSGVMTITDSSTVALTDSGLYSANGYAVNITGSGSKFSVTDSTLLASNTQGFYIDIGTGATLELGAGSVLDVSLLGDADGRYMMGQGLAHLTTGATYTLASITGTLSGSFDAIDGRDIGYDNTDACYKVLSLTQSATSLGMTVVALDAAYGGVGSGADNTISASTVTSANADGNYYVYALGGTDTITVDRTNVVAFGGAGTDTFVVESQLKLDSATLDGGTGTDTLRLGTGTFDFTGLDGYQLDSIEYLEVNTGSTAILSNRMIGAFNDGPLTITGDHGTIAMSGATFTLDGATLSLQDGEIETTQNFALANAARLNMNGGSTVAGVAGGSPITKLDLDDHSFSMGSDSTLHFSLGVKDTNDSVDLTDLVTGYDRIYADNIALDGKLDLGLSNFVFDSGSTITDGTTFTDILFSENPLTGHFDSITGREIGQLRDESNVLQDEYYVFDVVQNTNDVDVVVRQVNSSYDMGNGTHLGPDFRDTIGEDNWIDSGSYTLTDGSVVVAAAGDDVIEVANNNMLIFGGTGNDLINVDSAAHLASAHVLDGGNGNDTIGFYVDCFTGGTLDLTSFTNGSVFENIEQLDFGLDISGKTMVLDVDFLKALESSRVDANGNTMVTIGNTYGNTVSKSDSGWDDGVAGQAGYTIYTHTDSSTNSVDMVLNVETAMRTA